MSRPNWEQYALLIAEAASARSEDPYVQVGACILRPDNTIASVGYNGVPSGYSIDMSDRDTRRPYMVHAEANALRFIRPGEGRLLAVTLTPCTECLKLAKSYDINTIIYRDTFENTYYDLGAVQRMAFEFGVTLKKVV